VSSVLVRIGISRCLLGDEVRYDGGHKWQATLLDVIGPHVEWVPVCPEVELGMGTPREPIQLVAAADDVRLLGVTSRRDWTDAMRAWAADRVRALQALDLSGYIFKARSPSCGVHVDVASGLPPSPGFGGRAVALRAEAGSRKTGRGLFAQALIDFFPDLPVAEEDDVATPAAAEAFLARARAYRAGRG
jgi:uncharacterized protein YbbK (DUF523 family)